MAKKLLFAAVLSFLMAGQTVARQLTPSEALKRLMGDKTEQNVASKARRAQSANRLQLAYSSQFEGVNTFYAFNNADGGFVLLSADDCMPTVLGVVDKGMFDYNNMPSNVKWYLEMLSSNVARQAASGKPRKTITEAAQPPLLGAIEWDQGAPFNNEVPSYNGERAYVGCVATAAAQIMRYWQYPEKGTGSRKYKFLFDTKEGEDPTPTDSTEISTDFSAHTYDWNNMLEKYKTDSVNWNEAQGKAVSVLLKDVGVASLMRYGTSASGGSGTQSYKAIYGLVNYFGYDPSIQYVRHKFYTDDEWDNMIYSEFKVARPVMFSGNGADGSGGHAFVCDGFQDGKFHINWGWSGSYNGYFLLTGPGLSPEGTGSGGAVVGSSYGYDLAAAIGIMPSEGGVATKYLASEGYTCRIDGAKLVLQGRVYNLFYDQARYTVGVQIMAADSTCYNFEDSPGTLSLCGNFTSIDVTLADVPDGEYTIIPIFRPDGEENWSMVRVISTFKPATLKCEGGKYTVTNNDAPKIQAGGAVAVSKKSFRPTKKNEDGTLDAETLVLTCEEGIKNCDEKGQKLSFGCEFYDLTASNDSVDVYWLSNCAKTNAEELAPGASITTISVEILPELEAGHSYEVTPIFYVGVDDSLDDEAYWNALDAQAQYVDLGDNEAPVIDIVAEEGGVTVISKPSIINSSSKIYDINGSSVAAKNISELTKGVYIVKDQRGVRKIVKK